MRKLTVRDNPNHIMNVKRDSNDLLPAYAWPGGYPIVYYTGEQEALCYKCATEELDVLSDGDDPVRRDSDAVQWYDINYEQHEHCVECTLHMPGAYDE